MLNMTYEDGAFDVCLDKATIDALMADDSAEVNKMADDMLVEMNRVVKEGKSVCMSACYLRAQYIINGLLYNLLPPLLPYILPLDRPLLTLCLLP